MDAHKNLAVSTVATAPSPATSGTSLVVASGEGARFPAVPFNATIWPASSQPDPSNAEVVRVTAISTDTLTITRTQEGTSARTVVVTDQIAASITAKSFTDVEAGLVRDIVNPAAASIVTVPGVYFSGTSSTLALVAGRDYYFPILCTSSVTFDQLQLEVTAAGTGGATGRIGLFASDASCQPSGNPIEDFGTVAIDSTGVKTIAPAATTRTIQSGRYLLALNISATATVRAWRGGMVGGMVAAATGAAAFIESMKATRAYAAFPSPGQAWTVADTNNTGFVYPIFMRITAVA